MPLLGRAWPAETGILHHLACAGVELDHTDIQDYRHPTVAHLHRDTDRAANITIWVARTTQNPDERQRPQQFSQRLSVDRTSISAGARQARLLLKDVLNGRASDDHLRTELCGPSTPELTMVSIPTPKQLPNPKFTAQDVKILRGLAWDFFKGEHHTLLVVVPATHDYRDQDPWKLAKELDPGLERTMGVLTHLELAEPGSEREAALVRLMNNEQERVSPLGMNHIAFNRANSPTKSIGAQNCGLPAMAMVNSRNATVCVTAGSVKSETIEPSKYE